MLRGAVLGLVAAAAVGCLDVGEPATADDESQGERAPEPSAHPGTEGPPSDGPSPRPAPASGGTGLFDDRFEGNGPLLGFVTHNEAALGDVARVDGRYRASLTDNRDNVTLHYNQDQGRLDAKRLRFPFDVVARNIGIGTLSDSQTAPPSNR
ncbi:MAG: hypothetical protein AAGA56_24440, partial [Myxococcota bacterium]